MNKFENVLVLLDLAQRMLAEERLNVPFGDDNTERYRNAVAHLHGARSMVTTLARMPLKKNVLVKKEAAKKEVVNAKGKAR